MGRSAINAKQCFGLAQCLNARRLRMALFQFVPIPNYIHHFPYRQLIIVKCMLILCAVFQCILWWDYRQSLSPASSVASSLPSSPSLPQLSSTINPLPSLLSSASTSARWAPICNLLSLLFTAIAAWFMLQKFFWAKLDICLSLASLGFSFLSLLFSSHFYIVDAQLPGLLFALLNSLMLYLQSFSVLTAVKYAKNCVSNLFIKDWGAAEFSYMEVRELESDF
ncbi:hypothetical protein niasHS_005878 [Heterodera schachtii]|uniref:Uncharacterized protein n=1 Tax=Heterodera schachtii TaxID=97005 RepID=A0ABD2JS18_HETSC